MFKRAVNVALATTLSVSMLASSAIPAYAEDIAEGSSVETVESTETVDTNEGSVGTNEGTIDSNEGSVGTNASSGVINYNRTENESAGTSLGTVDTNAGTIGTNFGVVGTNLEGGVITSNDGPGLVDVNQGTINYNQGNRQEARDPQDPSIVLTDPQTGLPIVTQDAGVHTNDITGVIQSNDGYVGTNEGTIGVAEDGHTGNNDRVHINNGTITRNQCNATIDTNNGTVNLNTAQGSIGVNNGLVITNDSANGVYENNGQITTNDSLVYNNTSDGTVTTNSTTGTVKENAGDVLTNDGVVENNGDYVLTKDNEGSDVWTITTGTITVNNGEVKVNQGEIATNSDSATITSSNKGEVDRNFGSINKNNGVVKDNFGYVGTPDEGKTGVVQNNYAGSVGEGNTINQQWWSVLANPVTEFGKIVSNFFGAIFGGSDHSTVNVSADTEAPFNGPDIMADYVKDSGTLTVTPTAGEALLGFAAYDENGDELAVTTTYDANNNKWTLAGITQNAVLSYASAPITADPIDCGFNSNNKFAVGSDVLRPGDFVDCGSIMRGTSFAVLVQDADGEYNSIFGDYGLYAVADDSVQGGYVGEERYIFPTVSGKKYRYDGVQNSFIRFSLVDADAEYEPVEEHFRQPKSKTEDKKDEKNDKEDDSKSDDKKDAVPTTVVTDPVLTRTVLSTEVPATEPTAPSSYVDALAPTLTSPAEAYKAVDMSGRPLVSSVTQFEDAATTKVHTDFIESALKSAGVTFVSVTPAYTGHVVSQAANSVMTLRVSTNPKAKVFVVFVDPKTGKKTYVRAKQNKNGTISFDVPFANADFSVVEAK